MINRELEITLAGAIKEAKVRRHEYFTLEHILFAILHDVTGRRILYHCGADLEKLKARLEKYLSERIEKLPAEVDQDPIQTMAVQRAIQRAIMHVRSAEKKEVDAGDILAAMFFEENSYAVYFLKAEGVTRLDVVSYISHGISKVVDPEEEEFGGRASTVPSQEGKPEQRKASSPGKLHRQPDPEGRRRVDRSSHRARRRDLKNPADPWAAEQEQPDLRG